MATMHWFRKGLRLHDNPALLEACRRDKPVYPVFVLDPHFLDESRVGVLRMSFLLQALSDLHASLARLGSRLYVLQGTPEAELSSAMERWQVDLLTYEKDTEPYAVARDAAMDATAAAAGVKVSAHTSHTLHPPTAYLKGGTGPPPTSYTQFQQRFAAAGVPPSPLESPEAVPPGAKEEGRYHVPSLEDIGYSPAAADQRELFPGGETEGLRRLSKCLARPAWIASFEKPKTSPNSLQASTTGLSPYFKFGCVSPRKAYHEFSAIVERAGARASRPPVSLVGQLMWREFNYLLGSVTPNWGQMQGNPLCRQIPWDCDPALLAAWENAQTG